MNASKMKTSISERWTYFRKWKRRDNHYHYSSISERWTYFRPCFICTRQHRYISDEWVRQEEVDEATYIQLSRPLPSILKRRQLVMTIHRRGYMMHCVGTHMSREKRMGSGMDECDAWGRDQRSEYFLIQPE